MIPDYPNRINHSSHPAKAEAKQVLPKFGIGERVAMNNGTTDIYYVTGIIMRGAGMFTYLVSDRGAETEVREFEICSWDDLPDADEEDDE